MSKLCTATQGKRRPMRHTRKAIGNRMFPSKSAQHSQQVPQGVRTLAVLQRAPAKLLLNMNNLSMLVHRNIAAGKVPWRLLFPGSPTRGVGSCLLIAPRTRWGTCNVRLSALTTYCANHLQVCQCARWSAPAEKYVRLTSEASDAGKVPAQPGMASSGALVCLVEQDNARFIMRGGSRAHQ